MIERSFHDAAPRRFDAESVGSVVAALVRFRTRTWRDHLGRWYPDTPIAPDLDVASWHYPRTRRFVVDTAAAPPRPVAAGVESRDRPYDLPDFDCRELTFGGTTFRFEPLPDATALRIEGHFMGHCVGGYSPRCRRGVSVIVAMRSGDPRRPTRHLTIEVRPARVGDEGGVAGGEVVEVRGRRNRPPTPEERRRVAAWARANRLRW